MNDRVYSANDMCRTRICEARDCPNDAMLNHPICDRHDRLHRAGKRVTLHETPEQQPAVLRCNGCNQWLPDAEFPPKPLGSKAGGGRKADRRGRYCYCNACTNDHIQTQIRQFNDARKNQARRNARA